MKLNIDIAWLAAVFLIAVRFGPLFVLAPVFGTGDVPVRVRVFLALALSATFAALVRPSIDPSAMGQLLAAACGELVIGAALAFGLLAAFGALVFGGRLLDLQIGFGVATLIDPVTRGQSPLLGTLLNLVGITIFFAVDGHHILIKGFAASLEQFPLGQSIAELDVTAVIAQFGVVFVYGLAVIAPAMFALLLLDVALAVMARTMPQMNIFIVSMPLKVVVGLLVLALSARHMLPTLQKLFDTVPLYWEKLLNG